MTDEPKNHPDSAGQDQAGAPQAESVPIDLAAENRARIVRDQLAALERLRGMGMELADAVTRRGVRQLAPENEAAAENADVLAFTRVARAVRQIIVLEQELMGLRQPAGARGPAQGSGGGSGDDQDPERGDRNDLGDPNDFPDPKELEAESLAFQERVAQAIRDTEHLQEKVPPEEMRERMKTLEAELLAMAGPEAQALREDPVLPRRMRARGRVRGRDSP